MKDYQSLNHTKWDCKYHVVFIPKRRRKQIYGAIKKHLGEVFHELAKQKESKIMEGHLCSDHVHMCLSIPPKFTVSSVIGYIKGKSAISIARNFMCEKEKFHGRKFLGERLLCFNSGPGRGRSEKIHSRTRGRRLHASNS